MPTVAIDIGGTFTDVILGSDGRAYNVKVLTSDDVVSGLVEGLEEACDRAGVAPGELELFNHGSTIAVNALIEREADDAALITTEGFRDVLEIGEVFRDEALLYDPWGEYEPPVIPRRHRYEVRERLDQTGSVVTPLDVDDLDAAIDDLRESDVESVAVCLLHSYRNDEHERRIADRLAERAPDLDVSLSSAVSPQIREYHRTATTAVDAFVKPDVSSYIADLEATLAEKGLETPVNIMKSDGGLARAEIARNRPITQLISGPTAGVKAAQSIGTQIGEDRLITFDMGGTSTDLAIVENGAPVEELYRQIRGMKVNGPFVKIQTVGAGGGSIAWVDDVDALRVGPKSAGSVPGPICYGRGGDRPTVTDADVVLGVLNPEEIAGGELSVDVDAARDGIRERIAEPTGMGVVEAAAAVRNIVDNNVAGSMRVSTVKEGHDPRDFVLMGFGGAGPMHACNVALELGIDRVVFPHDPGLLSARGLLVADIQHEYVQSLVETVEDVRPGRINRTIRELMAEGRDDLDREAVDPSRRTFTTSFDMMYDGQAHYLNVRLDGVEVTAEALDRLRADFERIHRRRYGFVDERNAIELVNVRVTAVGAVDDPEFDPLYDGADRTLEAARLGTREVFLEPGTSVEAPRYEWDALPAAERVPGPAIVESANSTIWLPPAFEATADRDLNVTAREVRP